MKTKEELERLKKLDLNGLNSELLSLEKKWRELISKAGNDQKIKSDYKFIKKSKAKVLTLLNQKNNA